MVGSEMATKASEPPAPQSPNRIGDFSTSRVSDARGVYVRPRQLEMGTTAECLEVVEGEGIEWTNQRLALNYPGLFAKRQGWGCSC